MEQVTQDTIGEVVKQVAAAMSEAVREYGPDAVDLAMMAYRVEAAQQLLHGFAFMGAAAVTIIAYAKFWAWSGRMIEEEPRDEEGYYFGRIVGAIVVIISAAPSLGAGVSRLLDVSAWLAASGHPELRIAMKALEAAGLM